MSTKLSQKAAQKSSIMRGRDWYWPHGILSEDARHWLHAHAHILLTDTDMSCAISGKWIDCLQVRRDACADAARKLGWDKLFVVVPAQLKSSDNMVAELFEVSACTISGLSIMQPRRPSRAKQTHLMSTDSDRIIADMVHVKWHVFRRELSI